MYQVGHSRRRRRIDLQKLKTVSNTFKYKGIITQRIKSFEQYAKKLTGLTEPSRKNHKKQIKSHGGKQEWAKGRQTNQPTAEDGVRMTWGYTEKLVV